MVHGRIAVMATVSVGRFVPLPGQTVYLTDRASPCFVGHPMRLLIAAETTPSKWDDRRGRSAQDAAWLSLTGYELDPYGRRLHLRRHVSVYAPGIVLVGEPGVPREHGGTHLNAGSRL
jgi:hypothetical protein